MLNKLCFKNVNQPWAEIHQALPSVFTSNRKSDNQNLKTILVFGCNFPLENLLGARIVIVEHGEYQPRVLNLVNFSPVSHSNTQNVTCHLGFVKNIFIFG